MKNKRIEDCGSVSIEAAFIVTLTVMTLFILVVFSFYLHDRIILYESAGEAAAALRLDPDADAAALLLLKERCENDLLMTDLTDCSVRTDESGKAWASCTASFRLCSFYLSDIFLRDRGNISVQVAKEKKTDAEKFVRICRFVKRSADEISGKK